MKVLLVNKFHYMKGGSEKYYFTLAQAFEKEGHEVVFFSMQDGKNLPCKQEKYFVSNSSVGGGIKSKINMVLHMAYSKEAYKKMKCLLEAEKPELVILNLVHKQLTLSVIDAIKDYNPELPVFWTMHDLITVCPSYTMLNGNGEICEECIGGNFSKCKKHKCIRGSRLMSALSFHEAKYIKKHGLYNKVDLYICPSEFYKNKLELARFTTSPIVCLRNPLPIDTEYEVNAHDGGYILYLGRLSKEKGVKTLIDAVSSLNTKLVVLGTGPEEEYLKDYVSKSNIANVEFKGFVQGEELKNYIRGCRCVVLPSEWYENGPYSAMEAMALGKPLIVTDKGGLPELVKENINGYVYSQKAELSKKIEKLVALSPEEYEKLCLSSMQTAKSLFNPSAYVEKLTQMKGSLKNL